MSKHYIYKMEILENDVYFGSYIGQHKMEKKNPSCDGYKGSGSNWKKYILSNHIPVKKTILRICDDIEETNYWEAYYISQAIESGEFLWNIMKGGGGHESDRVYSIEELKAHDKERFKRWYENNQEHIIEYRRQYLKKNKDLLYAKKKKYADAHKEFYAEYYKQYYRDNNERLKESHKQYYEQNKDKINEHSREYWKSYKVSHADQIAQKNKRYNDEHKEKQKLYYSRPCCYNGETLTFRALVLRFRRKNILNPSKEAEKYLLKEAI